jgi:hypothetical protein
MVGITWRTTHLTILLIYNHHMSRLYNHHTIFSLFSVVASNQKLSDAAVPWMLDLWSSLRSFFGETGSSKWILSSAVTFDAVVLWFLDTFFFNVRRSLSLYFCFRPLFTLSWWRLPMICVAIITLRTSALDTPNEVTVLVTDAPVKHAPTICPFLQIWQVSNLSLLPYELLLTQCAMHFHWHYTAWRNKRISKDTHN